MKVLITVACAVCVFTSCMGDHSSRQAHDTGGANNVYHVKHDDTSKIDTFKGKSNDYSGSGGAGAVVTDTSKKDTIRNK